MKRIHKLCAVVAALTAAWIAALRLPLEGTAAVLVTWVSERVLWRAQRRRRRRRSRALTVSPPPNPPLPHPRSLV